VNTIETTSNWVVADWKVDSNVRALSTTRLGGVSLPPYDSMNLGLHVGDEDAHVQQNRDTLQSLLQLPAQPCWLKQTHSNKVSEVQKNGFSMEADGAYTQLANSVLVVLTADCLPVVISDTHGTCLAVVHAGWRGLAAGIIENALRKFKGKSGIHAWLGPAIGPSAFEVGEEVRARFTKQRPTDSRFFAPGNTDNKYWADLYGLATRRLCSAGCEYVSGGEYCTYTDAHRFHSYRRDGVSTGRMATLVWRNE